MWSEGFRLEERAARPPTAVETVVAWAIAVAASAMGVAEVVLSVLVTSEQLTSRAGSTGIGLLAIGLGFIGPYTALLSWRSAATAGKPVMARMTGAALVGFGVAAMAVAWLLLLHGFHRTFRLVP